MIKVSHPTMNISLRELDISDAVELFDLINKNRDFLNKHLGWLDKVTKLDDTKSFIAYCQQGNQTKRSLTFGICDSERLIGIVGFHDIDTENHTSSIGYWLAASYQGNGIMTQAVRALIDFTIREFSIEKITIRVSVQNIRSQAIPRKLGFTESGIKENGEIINGVPVNQIIFNITREQWQSQQYSRDSHMKTI